MSRSSPHPPPHHPQKPINRSVDSTSLCTRRYLLLYLSHTFIPSDGFVVYLGKTRCEPKVREQHL